MQGKRTHWPVIINEADWEILVCSDDEVLLDFIKKNDPNTIGYVELLPQHAESVIAMGKGILGPLPWGDYAEALGLLMPEEALKKAEQEQAEREAAQKRQVGELIDRCIKIADTAYSRGSQRVALHNLRVEMTGEGVKC
jgi:hypothetical protein